MNMTASTLRYQLPKKSVKGDCPDCGPKHRRTLSRYVDTRTGEPLPDEYGRCDRESNCGYHLSPYQKAPSGLSYADSVYEQWKQEQTYQQPNRAALPSSRPFRQPSISLPMPDPVHCLPTEVVNASLTHYERNVFAQLLQRHFGQDVANELLNRFQLGTSSHWPGACVFWLQDEQNRTRGGQVVLFDESGHTARQRLKSGQIKRCTTWAHYALASRYVRQQQAQPDWLTRYIDEADKFPVPFGLHQLRSIPSDQPIALVESPKTAVVCTPYFPQFCWMAIGSLSYLKAERLTALRSRKLVLFPDLNAYHDRRTDNGQLIRGWLSRAEELREEGYSITVSDYLESQVTDEEKADGLDLADYLLDQWKGYPPDWG